MREGLKGTKRSAGDPQGPKQSEALQSLTRSLRRGTPQKLTRSSNFLQASFEEIEVVFFASIANRLS